MTSMALRVTITVVDMNPSSQMGASLVLSFLGAEMGWVECRVGRAIRAAPQPLTGSPHRRQGQVTEGAVRAKRARSVTGPSVADHASSPQRACAGPPRSGAACEPPLLQVKHRLSMGRTPRFDLSVTSCRRDTAAFGCPGKSGQCTSPQLPATVSQASQIVVSNKPRILHRRHKIGAGGGYLCSNQEEVASCSPSSPQCCSLLL